jgi:hypothetical protein
MALLYALLAVHERIPLTPRRRAYALAEMAPEPGSMNQVVDEVGGASDPFVAEAARRVLERTEW